MDVNKLVDVLRATLDPTQREQAEQQLNEVHKIIGFAPILLQVVMSDQLDMPVKQAGAIYLKNMIMQFWHEREAEFPGDPVPFNIHDNDKQPIRDNIVEAVIHASDPIRVQLAICVSNIIKHDFPGRWPNVADKVAMYIQSDNHQTWMGALLCLYQLIKTYEYKKSDERVPLTQAMHVLLPLIYQRCLQLLPDQSELSVLIQKQILKCFHALIQYCLPLDLITKEAFTQWMELFRQIVERSVPEATLQIDEEERPELAWWKCKKWACHIITRLFERYGSPGNVQAEYNKFAEWYLKSFSAGIIQVVLKVLDQYRQKQYVSPRVLLHCLNYLDQGVSHAFSWKFMKPHMQTLVREVLFPLLCHSDEDEELWTTDPHEYIRTKYDVFEEFLSPSTAAQTLLHSAASKRKEILQKTMGFCMQMLSTGTEPRQKDGVLHIIGALADVLLKKKIYKDQVELMLANHVFPEFESPCGFLRARACWVLHYFCEVKFKDDANLARGLDLCRTCLCTDKELPVRVEAAIALQMLITNQEKAEDMVKPHVKPIILELLNVIRETENDDMTSVMQKMVCTFVEEVAPLAVEVTTHLAQTFQQVVDSDSDEGSDEKAIAAMGILNTLETILNVMEEQKEILNQLEGIVLNVIGLIFQQNMIEFYEEVLSLVYMLTCTQISQHLWQVFYMVYEIFQKDGFDYFTDMMPALHNYVTVDPQAFLANPKHLEIIYNMCKTVMTGDAGEDAECHAAKLLEVILLQYKGQVDPVVPSFVELALERLTRKVRTSELRTMCLQVVIAALYYNPQALLDMLDKMRLPNITDSITAQFVKQWLHDCDCFLGLHDRKISVLGLCTLMDTPSTRPAAINENASQILPSALLLFAGLKRAYASRAAAENEEGDDEDEEYEEDELGSDEDEIDEEGAEYLEKLERSANGDDDSDDEYDDEAEETALESYRTPLDDDDCTVDEYQVFKTVLQSLQSRDPSWYSSLTSQLTQEQQQELNEVFTYAEQRKAVQDSKKIEKSGGYVFANVSVPTNFNFG
ncbi:importin-7 [Lingula anatina]|uniref:Importin-7 n=1 Tax=Lingula anatina TaxID=7574 RepID=A0A1S3IKM7_LINAN|nr:importin-7 [Lingula anatina]|eukprot:XP_013398069.1 importin-7 [Lingula anatina]